ncbi:MAG: hypothetical protein ACXADD_18355 [Candidatus Thorarchaeota archaeon]|jgi:hypothetical protein
MISAEEWYKTFVEEFVKAAGDATNEIGIHYEKCRVRGTETNTEWTYCMAPLLYKYARKLGYFQECTKLDFLWYEGAIMHPEIAIEHENDWDENVLESEIPKLLDDSPDKLWGRASLRILITYSNGIRNDDILQEAKMAIVSNTGGRRKPFKFFLIIGGELHQPSDWKGYIWDEDKGDWIPIK